MIKLLWPLAIGTFSLGLSAYVIAGLMGDISQTFGSSLGTVALAVSLFTGAFAIAAPLSALTAQSVAPITKLRSGLLLFTLGNILSAFAPDMTILLLSRVISGAGAGIFSPLASASAAALVTPALKGRALGLVLAGLSMGSAFGVPVGLFIASYFGWRGAMIFGAVLGIFAFAGLFRLQIPHNRTERSQLSEIRSLLGRSDVLALLAITLLTAIASLGLYTFIIQLVVAGHGYSNTLVIWLWGLGGMIGTMLIGPILDRSALQTSSVTLILLMLMVTGFVLALFLPPPFVFMGCMLWGFAGWSSVGPQQLSLIKVSKHHDRFAVALNSALTYLGGAIGALIVGVFVDANHPELGIATVFIAAALAIGLRITSKDRD